MTSTAIIIPARYGSTRFPGKPLATIHGRSMLGRVLDVAQLAAQATGAGVYIATDDDRIATHAQDDLGATVIMTPESCASGSDRVRAAMNTLPEKPGFVVNLQGDAPFTPPQAVIALIEAYRQSPQDTHVITPVHPLSWVALDQLRENKKTTPFSGTTCVRASDGRALWFSKNILPAIRKEDRASALSPVHQHLGLYGYTAEALERFCALPEGEYERLEGLEQLRFLENNIPIRTILIDPPAGGLQSGIDSPEDLARAVAALK